MASDPENTLVVETTKGRVVIATVFSVPLGVISAVLVVAGLTWLAVLVVRSRGASSSLSRAETRDLGCTDGAHATSDADAPEIPRHRAG